MVVAIFGVLRRRRVPPHRAFLPAARVVEILERRAPLALVQAASYAALTTPAEDGVTPPPPLVLLSDAMGARGLDGKFVQSMEAAPLPCGARTSYVMYTPDDGEAKGVQVGHGPLMMRTSWCSRRTRCA